MGSAIAGTWNSEPPNLSNSCECLQGWSREDLKSACEQFKAQPNLAVNVATFMRLVKIQSRQKAEETFRALKPNKGVVDFISVLMVMTLLSDQTYISKVTFMFSVADLNSSGTISHAEFCIGMRALFIGVSHSFLRTIIPALKDIEQLTDAVFSRIDTDRSGYVHLEEILTFAYRATELRSFMAPFGCKDKRVFEELVYFYQADTNIVHKSKFDKAVRSEERRLGVKDKLRLTPDPSNSIGQGRKKSIKPWKQATMSKGHAYILWQVFRELTDSQFLISVSSLMTFLQDQKKISELIQKSERDAEVISVSNADVARKTQHISHRLTEPDIIQDLTVRLNEGENPNMTLRELCCLVWPRLHEKDIEHCVKWCNLFNAQDVITELLEGSSQPHLNVADVQALFEVIDTNGDGQLTIEELCACGNLSPEKARQLVHKCDTDSTNTVCRDEILSVIYGISSMLGSRLKGSFSASQRALR